ncbi:hypothetical protein [Pandoraea pnomenusa]|uniref:hypothetical protein n=1 Tax=Pandoraea pnomenusa TaxID=93220 RepID=UPI001AC3CB4A|nr:hypothetical protein [Pandoraea pnomenusa]MBN9093900.1 hypothetical protein [Pandoraea pnomenusa]
MELRDQASGTDVAPTADATLSIADVELTGRTAVADNHADSVIATEADVAGVSGQFESSPDMREGPATLPGHESLLYKLLSELEHVEHMGKSEVAAVVAKFRALV